MREKNSLLSFMKANNYHKSGNYTKNIEIYTLHIAEGSI